MLDSEGNLNDTAWKYDTYYLMRHCMVEIKEHPEIKDVVLDLSLNGGGNTVAMWKAIGFMTDVVIPDYAYNTLTNEFSCSETKVDTDGDGYYDDDAFDECRWTVLSSLNTFSAANNLICKVRQMGIAKVIGQRSGGGMCSVARLALADGTAITISFQNSLEYVARENDQNIYYSTEGGFAPDLEVPYEDFYDDEKIAAYVDETYDAAWTLGIF